MMDLIDREQALNVLDAEAWSFTEYLQKDIGNVFDVHLACFVDDVRERLKDMPTVQAVPIEVLQEILQEIEERINNCGEGSFKDGLCEALDIVYCKIKEFSE